LSTPKVYLGHRCRYFSRNHVAPAST
jgi:transposase